MGRQALALSDFADLFRSFKTSAFRLETLAQYLVDDEMEAYAAYRAGQPLPPSRTGALKDWDEFISRSVSAGKSFRRVHVLPDRLTPYLRFEIDWAYLYTAAMGEEIHLLLADAPPSVRAQAKEDFWLFDDSVAVFLVYGREGQFVGTEVERDLAEIRECCRVRDLVLRHSVPLRTYLAMIRNA